MTMSALSHQLDRNHLTVLARTPPQGQPRGAAIILCNIAPSVNATAPTERRLHTLPAARSELRLLRIALFMLSNCNNETDKGNLRVPLCLDWSVYVRQLQVGCSTLVPGAASSEVRPEIIHRYIQSGSRSLLPYERGAPGRLEWYSGRS